LDLCHIYVSAEISLYKKRKLQKQLNNVKGKSGGLANTRRAKSTIPYGSNYTYKIFLSSYCLYFGLLFIFHFQLQAQGKTQQYVCSATSKS
jgi:hypothetical protein